VKGAGRAIAPPLFGKKLSISLYVSKYKKGLQISSTGRRGFFRFLQLINPFMSQA
jgi:hypothetical protein